MANMTFIELTVNAFDNVFHDRAGKRLARRGAGADSVRRPLRGIEVKDDTYAVIRVVRANGEEVPLISSSYKGGHGTSYTNFILQSVTDAREEKAQIVETFGIPYIFFYGQRPHVLEVQAFLINTLDFNWEAEFWENYDRYLRGTKCVEMGARVYLFYDDNIVEGYMMRASASKQAADGGRQVAMQFSMLLTNYANVSMIDSSTYPVRPSSMSAVYEGTDELDDNYVETIGGQLDGVSWLIEDAVDREVAGETRRQNASTLLARINKGMKMRGDITDNYDEWTGGSTYSSYDRLAIRDDRAPQTWDAKMEGAFWEYGRQLQEEEQSRLADKAMEEACARNAAANNPSFLRGMGLLGGGVSIGVQFGASAGVSVGASAGAQFSAGAGAGYYGGQAVGYDPFGKPISGAGGQAGFYAGAGYFGSGQYGTPGYGSGASPSSLAFGGRAVGAGAYAGWSPGTGAYSGTYSYSGNVPTGAPYAGPAWMPSPDHPAYGATAGCAAGASAVVTQAGYAGGIGASFNAGFGFGAGGYTGGAFYGGVGSYQPYAAPGYATGGYNGGTASNQYYAGTYAGWDPINGAYSGSYYGSPGEMTYEGTWPYGTNGPMPGQPGGGVFTTQAFPTGDSMVVGTPGAGASQGNPYAFVDPQQCADRANFLIGGPG